ncbi:hypothetical protein [Mycoplasma sp. HS2188]|nr:hypothetical protein [Mycoplasma sp. HS2188]
MDKKIINMFSEKNFKEELRKTRKYEPENEKAFEIIFKKLAKM